MAELVEKPDRTPVRMAAQRYLFWAEAAGVDPAEVVVHYEYMPSDLVGFCGPLGGRIWGDGIRNQMTHLPEDVTCRACLVEVGIYHPEPLR